MACVTRNATSDEAFFLPFFFSLPECHKDGSSLDVALSYHLSVAPIDVMAPRLVSSRRRALILISWPNEASQLVCGSGGKRSSAKTGTFCALVNKATGMESWQCERDDVSPTDMREGGKWAICILCTASALSKMSHYFC